MGGRREKTRLVVKKEGGGGGGKQALETDPSISNADRQNRRRRRRRRKPFLMPRGLCIGVKYVHKHTTYPRASRRLPSPCGLSEIWLQLHCKTRRRGDDFQYENTKDNIMTTPPPPISSCVIRPKKRSPTGPNSTSKSPNRPADSDFLGRTDKDKTVGEHPNGNE